MPKGVPLTDEQKEKMAEGRRRANEQKKALEDQNASEAAAAAVAEANQPEPPQAKVVEPTRHADEFADAQAEYGPFRRFTEVQTPYGLYGLPANTIMHFEPGEAWMAKENRMINTMVPVRRKVAKAKV